MTNKVHSTPMNYAVLIRRSSNHQKSLRIRRFLPFIVSGQNDMRKSYRHAEKFCSDATGCRQQEPCVDHHRGYDNTCYDELYSDLNVKHIKIQSLDLKSSLGGIALGAVAATVAWLVYLPYREDKVLRALLSHCDIADQSVPLTTEIDEEGM